MQQLLKIDKKMWIDMTDEINIRWHRISGAKANEILRKQLLKINEIFKQMEKIKEVLHQQLE